MPLFEAVRLALSQIRAQKLKSFFTLLGVMIGVMFLIAVVSIVEGMGRYMKDDLMGKLIPINTFQLRRNPDVNLDVGETLMVDTWLADGTAQVRYRGANWTVTHLPGVTPATGLHRVREIVGSRLVVEKI